MQGFVDSHCHFWDLTNPNVEYAWLGPGTTHNILGDIEGLKVTRYAVEEYRADTRFHGVEKVIHVQVATTADPVAETIWLQSLADQSGFPHGIIAYCDLGSSDATETLDRQMKCRNVRGIRQNVPPDTFLDEDWQRGYALLAERQLVFCHQVGWENAGKAAQLIRRFPEVTFCVDHAGMPRERDDAYFASWSRGMREIASCDNAVCKISALGMNDRRWTTKSLAPWVLACVDAFGIGRCFFGSNWPVDRLFSGYGDLLGSFSAIIDNFSAGEKRALWSGNAERIFRV